MKTKDPYEILQELIRTAYSHLEPVDKYSYLYNKGIVQRLQGERPKCFMKLTRKDGGPMGQPLAPYHVPVCNRAGFEDPDIISLSIKFVQKLMSDKVDAYDINDLKGLLGRLQHKRNVFSKDIPHPPNMAGRKANMTRMFNNIEKHMKKDY